MEINKQLSELQERNRDKVCNPLVRKPDDVGFSASYSELDQLTTDTFNAGALAVIGEIKEYQKGWLGNEEDGSDRAPEYDIISDLLDHLATLEENITNRLKE